MDTLNPLQISRRRMIQLGLATAAATMASPLLRAANVAAGEEGTSPVLAIELLTYPFSLPELPYGFDALEPSIDARTMEIHLTKHHAAYVNNLNAALEKHPEFQSKTLFELLSKPDALPEDIRTAVRNNGGGHANHSLFWLTLANPATEPSKELTAAVEKAFGSFDVLGEQLRKAGAGQFGSGWGWLVLDSEQNLKVISTPNQDSPWRDGKAPLLGVDVWEHAYYLKYQNRRADYLNEWWKIVDWETVSERFAGL